MALPPLIPLDEAQARLLAMAQPLGRENVPVEQAVGRFLAADLLAKRTQPPADLSAMDGYAMRADDLSGPWQVIGESAAGHPFQAPLAPGEAIRISTGAMMPAGGGAVLLQEEAERVDDRLALAAGGEASTRHVRQTGFDFRTGDLLLPAGSRVTPAQLALAISSGHGELAVTRLPSVAVLDSGDELARDPSQCLPHQIPASNGAMIAAMAAPFARRVARIGPVADRMDALAAALEEAKDFDVLVTSGGASVGDHDLVRPALEESGARIDFWRIAIKPGKPLMVASRGRQLIVGLPGNPVSSYVTAFLFLMPLLRHLAGARNALPRKVRLALSDPMPPVGNRMEFARATHDGGEITPLQEQDSSALAALAAATALIRREPAAAAAARGDLVEAYLIENGGIA